MRVNQLNLDTVVISDGKKIDFENSSTTKIYYKFINISLQLSPFGFTGHPLGVQQLYPLL